jgi:hypothetical protein
MKFIAIVLVFVISKAQAVVHLDCTFSYSPHFEVIGTVYECMTFPLIVGGGQNVASVTGSHQMGMTDSNVQMLFLTGNDALSFVPRGIREFFPNVIAIEMANTGLEVLDGNEFVDLPQLQWLTIRNSILKRISGDLFVPSPSLAFVDFKSNFINHIGENLFAPLNPSSMSFVGFTLNWCINQEANNPTQIATLIENLKRLCPYDDTATTTLEETTTELEETTTTTEDMATTESIVVTTMAIKTTLTETEEPTDDITTTSESSLGCGIGSIDERVCRLEDRTEYLEEYVEKLTESNENLQTTVNNLEDEMQWMRQELLRLTTNPCACK